MTEHEREWLVKAYLENLPYSETRRLRQMWGEGFRTAILTIYSEDQIDGLIQMMWNAEAS
ncbi:MAG: hypothetical protein ACR2M1_10430 [Gemmatimonadaceae bacterium]